MDDARRGVSAFDAYTPTPLVSLPGLADRLGVGVVGTKENALVARRDGACEASKLARHRCLDDVAPLGIDSFRTDRAAAEQPYRTAREQGAVAVDEVRR